MREPGREGWRLWNRHSESTAYVAGVGAKVEDAREMAFDVLAIAVSGTSRGRLG